MIAIGQKKGIVLILVFMVMVTLTVVVAVFLEMVSIRTKNAGYEISDAKAFWIAEAGVQKAVYNFKATIGYSANPQSFTESFGGGTYKVLLVLPAPDPKGGYDFTSTGTFGGMKREISCNITGGSSVFNYAGFGNSSVTMSNSASTDSYNSSSGRYNVNGNIGHNGSVGGNADISMSNSAYIDGNASTGSSGSFSDPKHKYVYGTVTNANSVSLPPITVPSTLTGLASGVAINLSNSATMTLNSSTSNYKYSTINLSNSATLTINANTAPVNIYVTGTPSSINISNSAQIIIPATNIYPVTFYTDGGTTISNGSMVNNSYIPANLILYDTGTYGISISNSGDFYGAIYAPSAGVSMSNSATIYGSVIAGSLTMSNSADIHYDTALTNVTMSGGTSGYSVKKWHEVIPAI